MRKKYKFDGVACTDWGITGDKTQMDNLGSSKDTNYDRIPKKWTLPRNTQYLHVVSNKKIDGFRASIYNATPFESVEALLNLMKSFNPNSKN